MLTDQQDACGHLIMDYWHGVPCSEIIEREDGYCMLADGPATYFADYNEWSEQVKQAISHAAGRVLDIGCGAGSHILYLQQKGYKVTGIDISPLAVDVCKGRGAHDARILSVAKITRSLGKFDTILMFGGNLGLLENREKAKWLLKRLAAITTQNGLIIGETRDPHKTNSQENLDYHRLNIQQGRFAGQVRLRVRYRKYRTPWFNYLFVSKEELRALLIGTGWQIQEVFEADDGMYNVILGKIRE